MTSSKQDVSQISPALRIYMTLQAVETMAPFKQSSVSGIMSAIQQAGYQGVQFAGPQDDAVLAECASLGLGRSQFGQILDPAQAEPLAASLAQHGMECGAIHLGTGFEDENEGAALIEAVLNASARHNVPLYVETHRATVFQDMWRTVQFVRRFPELRFNGDFSHWYTGSEMVYGDLERKFQFIAPVLERIGYIHGRIGNPGCMQVDLGDGDTALHPYIDHFKVLWTSAFAGFLASASPTDFICFTPELLHPEIYYARVFPNADGNLVEESDRWQQSQLLAKIARQCFADAKTRIPALG